MAFAESMKRPFKHFVLREAAGPTLTTIALTIRPTWGIVQRSILRSLKNLCPNIERASIYLDELDPDEELSELLFNQEHRFSAERVPSPSKRGTFPEFDPESSSLGLSCHSLPIISKLLHSIRRSPKAIHVTIEEQPTPEDIRTFIMTIQDICSQDRLEAVTLSWRGVDNHDQLVQTPDSLAHPLVLEDFAPLMSFNKLVEMEIETYSRADLSDGDLLALASSWPDMRILVLRLNLGTASMGITPPSLLRVLQRCKSLDTLSIAIDTRDFTNIPKDRPGGGYTSSISLIEVVDSVITEMEVIPLAVFFSDVCPNVCIEGYHTRSNQDFVQLWTRVRHLSRRIVQVREQERRWSSGLSDAQNDGPSVNVSAS
ncbi:hypothetical protein F5I97DRAFT_1928176 [Phlebopus sp. FC_14]|nr:hypothetical protein F5I97DRAFT_1928176 [Phlebopus sp. FC_14]